MELTIRNPIRTVGDLKALLGDDDSVEVLIYDNEWSDAYKIDRVNPPSEHQKAYVIHC